MNKFMGIGYLGDNPEPLTNGCKLSVCIAYWNGKENKNLWIKVFVFGKCAELCTEHLTKGRKIAIDGRLDQSKAGNMVIVSDNIQFL